MAYSQVLTLDIAGNPFAWLEPEEALRYYTNGKVAWELGYTEKVFRGGTSNAGIRSEIRARPIIAIAGSEVMIRMMRETLPLGDRDNSLLFRRDRYICAYCGERHPKHLLTRDHVVPTSKGGENRWENCVTACRLHHPKALLH